MKIFNLIILSLLLGACTTTASQTVSVNGVTIDYVVKGKGPPLYLLHGGMESRDSFDHQISEFAKRYTVVAPDSRGQGRSSRGSEPISYKLMSEDVIDLAAHLGHERISILGVSDGGITAITTALAQPALIDKLVLMGSNYHFDAYPEDTRAFIANYQWDGNTDPNGYPGMFIEHYLTGHDDLGGFAETLGEMSQMWTSSPTYSAAELKKIEAKTLVMNGDREDMDLAHVLSLYNALPNAQLFIIPGGTHFALEEMPVVLNAAILSFLEN